MNGQQAATTHKAATTASAPEAVAPRYQIRVELDETTPPLWRRIEVSSHLHLDQLHDVLQAAVGWTDSHLHRFASQPDHGPSTHHYLCPFDVAEGDEGTPEEHVRIDDVLAAVGDRLYYQYDYGDDWRHTLELEAILPADREAPAARCLDGVRPGPPEDCGGVDGYELMVAVSDPDHADHQAARREFVERYGDEPEPGEVGVVPLDVEAVNLELADLDLAPRPRTGPLPEVLDDLLRGVFDPRVRRRLLHLVADAELDRDADVDIDTAARMVQPYRWLLDRVGDDGIRLTGAGYLPPAHVKSAFTELGLDEEWVGAGNRESETLPVLRLRETAQEFGLLRKARGHLTLTRRGHALKHDPLALWLHLAERMPAGRRDEATRQAGITLLLAVAAGLADDPRPLVTQVLAAKGWRHQEGTELSAMTVGHLLWVNLDVLRRLGAVTGRAEAAWPGQPTSAGMAFARAALAR